MTDSRSSARTEPQRFVISFAGVDRSWAVWIQHRLERLGHSAVLQRWDLTGTDPVDESFGYLLQPGGRRVVLVLSRWYFRLGPHQPGEWNAVFAGLHARELEQLSTFLVGDTGLPPSVPLLDPTDLVDIPEAEAERRLLRGLGLTDRPVGPGLPALPALPAPRYPGAPAAIWGGVPRRARNFTGRDELLEGMRQLVLPDEDGGRPCVLLGMSGIGKSHLAAEYAHRYHADYDVVWWVPAGDRAVMRQRLAELAGRLGGTTGQEVGEQIRTVREALRLGDPYARWLIVFDGADVLGEVTALLPEGRGHVIVTSRNTDWRSERTSIVEVPVYQAEEAVAFTRRRVPRLDREEAGRLADALGRLPLMLDHATGWLDDSGMGVDEYIGRLQGDEDMESAVRLSTDDPDVFQKTLAIMLSQFRDSNQLAVEVLRLCSCFGPGRVPVQLVRPATAKDLPESLREVANEPLRWYEAVATLRRFSMVTVEYPEPGGDLSGVGETIELHPMMQLAARSSMDPERREEMRRTVRQMLAAADPGNPDNSASWRRYAEILPHIVPSGALLSTNPVIQELVINVLHYLQTRGEYATGQALARQAAEAWRQQQGAGYPRFWDLRHREANLSRALAQYATSERLSREAVDHLTRERSPEDFDLIRAMSGLAADLRALARFDEAHAVSEAVLARYEALLGPDDTRTLLARHNLGVGLSLMGRYQQSFDLNRELLATRRSVLGWGHPATLLSAYCCARDLRLLGRYDEALSRQQHALDRDTEYLGPDHPLTLRSMHHLGLCLRRLGAVGQADSLLREAVRRTDLLLGPNHPDALAVRADLGNHLREDGDLSDARSIAESVRHGYAQVFGEDHPCTVGADSNLALVLRAFGEREQARDLMDGVTVRMERAVGRTHPWTIGTLLNSSSCHNLCGDLGIAARLSEDALQRATGTLGPDHPLRLSSGTAFSADLRALGRRTEALKVEEEMLGRLQRAYGLDHPHTRSARSRTRPYWDIESVAT